MVVYYVFCLAALGLGRQRLFTLFQLISLIYLVKFAVFRVIRRCVTYFDGLISTLPQRTPKKLRFCFLMGERYQTTRSGFVSLFLI
ncbi:hypothetical protein T281_01200 [Rhodomicrobium udaipurense JA643]|nr:hypothetical protein T281_01200 [Rhodomicrobium udaipurense JA643]